MSIQKMLIDTYKFKSSSELIVLLINNVKDKKNLVIIASGLMLQELQSRVTTDEYNSIIDVLNLLKNK